MNKNKNSKPFEFQIWFSPQWRMSSRQSKISMSKQMEIQTRSWYALCSVPLSPGSPNKRRAIMRTTTRSTLPRAATLRPRSSLTGSWARPPAGGQAAVSLSSYVRTYVRTVSDWDAWYFQASGSCQCLVEDHTYLLYNFGIFPFYDFWDFGCHTELDVNGLAPKISIDMSLYIFNHFNANLKHNQQQLKICNKIPVIMTICNWIFCDWSCEVAELSSLHRSKLQ